MINNIISQNFKNIFNMAIDEILSNHGLTMPCRLQYANTNPILCNNCLFDQIANRSSSIYNNEGPAPFANLTICPICNGQGFTITSKEETLNLAVIFDSKYWLKIKYDPVKITDGTIQTICSSTLLNKIRNTQRLLVDINKQNDGTYLYERDCDPELAGFGDTRYIITMWKRL